MKFGGGSVMVWGAIKEDGTKILIRCPDRLEKRAVAHIYMTAMTSSNRTMPRCLFVAVDALAMRQDDYM